MRRRPLESLGGLVREKRGKRTLRETASEIGIGSATLLRVESGRVPDVSTFGKLCLWLGRDPREFLGSPAGAGDAPAAAARIEISAHLRADRTPQTETMRALASMLMLAAGMQPTAANPSADDHA